MKTPRVLRFGLAALVASLAPGCSQTVYSPPSRGMPLESARTAGMGKTGVAIEGAKYGEIFGPDLLSLGFRGRRGVRDDLDLTADVTAARVVQASAAGTNRGLYAARFGAKAAPAQGNGWFAFGVGAGAGYAPAGGSFVSADAGFIVSAENCYLVPSLAVSAFVSEALAAKEIDLTQPGDETPMTDTAETTLGYQWRVGLELPLSHARCPMPPPVALTAGLGMTSLYDSDDHGDFISLAFGIELNL